MHLPRSFYDRVHGQLATLLDDAGLDGVLVTNPGDVAYLIGFFYAVTERPVYLWFGTDGQRFCLVPALDEEYAQAQGIDAEIVSYFEYPGVESPESHLAAELTRRGRGAVRIGYSAGISLATAEKLRAAMPDAAFITTSAIAGMRLSKQPEEIAFHRQAAEVCDLMLASGRSLIEERIAASAPLPTEGELARHVITFGTEAMYERYEHVIYTTKLAGGLVYAGPNSARPHGLPSSRRLEVGDTLILSLGAAVASRFVESERTFIIGEPSEQQALYFTTALRAQEVGTQALRSGRSCADANAECLAVIEDAGFGHFIRHRQGHGIGIAQHEPPWLESGDDTLLAPGMIVSSEPGIYVPGHAGYRISDSVLITESEPERLTAYPRSLEQNVIPA